MTNQKTSLLNVEKFTEFAIKQAESKNWGVLPPLSKEEFRIALPSQLRGRIIVSEKMVLIHSEIDEAADALDMYRFAGDKSFREECADIAQRVLHIAAIYGLKLSGKRANAQITSLKEHPISRQLLDCHKATTKTWELFRRGGNSIQEIEEGPHSLEEIKKGLQSILGFPLAWSVLYNFDLNKSFEVKWIKNWGRDWKHVGETFGYAGTKKELVTLKESADGIEIPT